MGGDLEIAKRKLLIRLRPRSHIYGCPHSLEAVPALDDDDAYLDRLLDPEEVAVSRSDPKLLKTCSSRVFLHHLDRIVQPAIQPVD